MEGRRVIRLAPFRLWNGASVKSASLVRGDAQANFGLKAGADLAGGGGGGGGGKGGPDPPFPI